VRRPGDSAPGCRGSPPISSFPRPARIPRRATRRRRLLSHPPRHERAIESATPSARAPASASSPSTTGGSTAPRRLDRSLRARVTQARANRRGERQRSGDHRRHDAYPGDRRRRIPRLATSAIASSTRARGERASTISPLDRARTCPPAPERLASRWSSTTSPPYAFRSRSSASPTSRRRRARPLPKRIRAHDAESTSRHAQRARPRPSPPRARPSMPPHESYGDPEVHPNP